MMTLYESHLASVTCDKKTVLPLPPFSAGHAAGVWVGLVANASTRMGSPPMARSPLRTPSSFSSASSKNSRRSCQRPRPLHASSALRLQQVIVFAVVADPEPDQPFRPVSRQNAVMQTHSRGPKGTDFFQPKGRVMRVVA